MGLKLGLITIVVPEYDMGTRFFVDGLGFELITDEDQGHKRWVVVAPPGGGSHILLARATNSRQSAAIGNQTGGRVGFFLQTDTFDETARAIERAGGQLTETPRDEIYGQVAVFRDPFGNLWDLIQPKG